MPVHGTGGLPVVAIIGRPNVGKSTLFNRLTSARRALVHDQPGVTRDRMYGIGYADSRQFLIIDTGGLTSGGDELDRAVRQQSEVALLEADAVVWLLDAREGLTVADHLLAQSLREIDQSLLLVVNKAEGLEAESARADFHELGMGHALVISARTGYGVDALWLAITECLPVVPWSDDRHSKTRIAVTGRPNVGKSTLVNAFVGADRMLVSEEPGTTRDSVSVPLRFRESELMLIDTAGVRRKAKVRGSLEKFSVAKTLQAVSESDVAVLVFDACVGLTEQDVTIAGLICEQGRAITIAVNKVDDPSAHRRRELQQQMERMLPFLPPHRVRFVSAKNQRGINSILLDALEAVKAAGQTLATAEVNKVLNDAQERHAPPRQGGRAVRIKYAHQGGRNPPTLVLHGNLLERLPAAYRRYLANYFIKAFGLIGTPLRIETKTARNPYRTRH